MNTEPIPESKKLSEMTPEELRDRLRQTHLEAFQHDRYDLIEDIPEELITHADPRCMRYKSRGNVFNGVRQAIKQLLQYQVIDDPIAIESASAFSQWYWERDKAEFFVREEVDYLNDTLDIVIESLKT
jgi:hypothetical protein